MKRLITITFCILVSITASSQKLKFKNPAFQQGGWIAPTLTFGGGVYFGFKAIQANNHIYTTSIDNNLTSDKDEVAVKAATIYSVVCFSATAVISLAMHSDRDNINNKLRISNTTGLMIAQFGSGFFNGWHEAIQAGHWGKGQFWDGSISWQNKYKSDLKTPRFPGSTNIFVFTTDGYHLTSALSNACNGATLVILLHGRHDKNWKTIVKKLLLSAVSNRAGFYLSYNMIFKRN